MILRVLDGGFVGIYLLLFSKRFLCLGPHAERSEPDTQIQKDPWFGLRLSVAAKFRNVLGARRSASKPEQRAAKHPVIMRSSILNLVLDFRGAPTIACQGLMLMVSPHHRSKA